MSDNLRPSRYCDSVFWSVARSLASDFMWQVYEDAEAEGYDGSEFQALVETLRDEPDWDGFALAKHLEDVFSMAMDASMVNILDSAYIYQHKAHRTLVEQWVLHTQATPKYAVHDAVQVRTPGKPNDPVLAGVVTLVQASVLRYIVHVQEHAESQSGVYLGTYYNEEEIVGLGC